MAVDAANWIDYLTLIAASFAAAGPLVQVWMTKRGEREKLDLSLQWGIAPDPSGAPEHYPFLHIHNRSSHHIYIHEIFCARRPLFTKRCRGTALYYEDPYFDVSFPYEVKSGETRGFRLQEHLAQRELDKVGIAKAIAAKVRRSSVWIGVTTTAGTKKMMGAEAMIPWGERPAWTKNED